MFDKPLPYILYSVSPQSKIVLTSRPDSYETHRVQKFITEFNPIVRFQFTDDRLRVPQAKAVPYHWYSWFPGRRVPLEIAYNVISLLNTYMSSDLIVHKTLWFHCDSSTMRAPTFFGLYLMCYHKEVMDNIIADSTYNDNYKRKSCPKLYAETSMNLDPGMRELIENWQEGGEDQAHNFLANLRN